MRTRRPRAAEGPRLPVPQSRRTPGHAPFERHADHLKLLEIHKSSKGSYKYDAEFDSPRRGHFSVSFGRHPYEDFTMHHDDKRRAAYLKRHAPREHFDDPTTAGALSRWLLWEKPTLEEAETEFRARFGL
jgi:hypothetical protein